MAGYLLLGAGTGVLAGLLGIGGGLIIVPTLVGLFSLQGMSPGVITHLAIGTSLATIVPTALASTRAHHRHGAVQWDLLRALGPGVALGALLGSTAAAALSTQVLGRVFGIFEVLMGAYLLAGRSPRPGRTAPSAPVLGGWGGLIGGFSSLLGIGGGTLTVPLLTWFNVPLRQAIATAAATGLPIALAGTGGFIVHGLEVPDLPAGATGYVYWPAFAGIALAAFFTARFGAALTHRLPVATVRQLFAAVLILLGIRMLWA